MQKAEKSIRFYQNIKATTADGNQLVQSELEKLKRQFEDKQMIESQVKRIKWTDIKTNPGRKALIIGVVFALLSNFSGSFVIITFVHNIFKEAGSILSENESALIIATIQLGGLDNFQNFGKDF